jgi:hypothetical protein
LAEREKKLLAELQGTGEPIAVKRRVEDAAEEPVAVKRKAPE